jgi:Tfp pilus assembly protein PilN
LLHAEQQDLVAQHDESLLKLTSTELAKAARRLLPNTTKQQRLVLGLPNPTKRQQRIALCLPNEEFVGTTLQLPPIALQNLKNAVSLQLPTLLPGITEPLLLAVQPTIASDNFTTALWMPAKRAEELFKAFAEEGLFLAAILPRALATLPTLYASSCQIYDEDETTVTCITWQGTTIQHWLHLPKVDLELAEFRAQLDQFLATLNSDEDVTHSVKKTSLDDWENSPMPSSAAYAYAFTPPGASLQITQAKQRRKRHYLYALAGLIILSIIGGLGAAHLYKQKLKNELAVLLAGLKESSELPGKIQQIEDEIAPIKEFPRQNVIDVLTKLNALIPKDSWLIGFSIEAGKVEIEGYSPNVTNLLNILAGEESFEKPHLSRTIRGDEGRKEENFGIRFNLKNIDVPNYWMRYIQENKGG